jgi:hypothetical protein
MINLSTEITLSLAEAARRLPSNRRGRPVTMSCILRWVLEGVRTPEGVVRLDAIRLGGRWLTSLEALQRFAERQTPTLEDATATLRSPASRQRAAKRAGRELDRIGI